MRKIYTAFTTVFIAGVVLPLAFVACRGTSEQTRPRATESATGVCPKLEGSYFGANKSAIRRGEVVTLSWQIPREYGRGMEIEGLPPTEPPTIRSFTAEASNAPLPAEPWSEFATGRLLAKPDRTLTFRLKATGPAGCAPLELPATVKVE
jgi:hypothetical protein